MFKSILWINKHDLPLSVKILYVYGKKHMKKLKAVTAIPSIETQFVLLAVYDNL